MLSDYGYVSPFPIDGDLPDENFWISLNEDIDKSLAGIRIQRRVRKMGFKEIRSAFKDYVDIGKRKIWWRDAGKFDTAEFLKRISQKLMADLKARRKFNGGMWSQLEKEIVICQTAARLKDKSLLDEMLFACSQNATGTSDG